MQRASSGIEGAGGVPVFLDALLAVGEVLVDLHQLGLEHHPVRLQSRQYVDQVRLGLCQQRRTSRHIAHASGAAALHWVCADLRKGGRGKGRAAALKAQRPQPHGAGRGTQRPAAVALPAPAPDHVTHAGELRPGCSDAAAQHAIPPRRCMDSLPALQRAALSRAVPAAAVCRRASMTTDPCSPSRHSTAPAHKPTVHLAPAPPLVLSGGFEMELHELYSAQTWTATNFSLNGTN
jgi:hypothetical protein